MQKPKDTRKQERQRIPIGAGSSIGGVLLLSGVVAIATVVSISAIKLKNRLTKNTGQEPRPPLADADEFNKPELNGEKKDDGDQVKVSSDCDPSGRTGGGDISSQDDAASLNLTECPLLDKKSVLNICGHKKTPSYLDVLLCDFPKSKSSSLMIDTAFNTQEYQHAEKHHPVMQLTAQGKEEENGGDGSVEREDKVIDPNVDAQESSLPVLFDRAFLSSRETTNKTKFIGNLYTEEHPQMQLIEKEKEEDGDTKVETGEEAFETVPGMNQFADEGEFETIEVTGEHKEDENEAANHEGEEYDEMATVDTTQNDGLPIQVDLQDTKEEEESLIPNAPRIEAEENLQCEEELDYNHGASIEKKEEELIEKIDEDSQVTWIAEEEDSYENSTDEYEGDIAEKSEASSEGTGDSYMRANTEAVWPAESMEEILLELKQMKDNNQILEEEIDNYRTMETEKQRVKNCNNYADSHRGNEDACKFTANSRMMNLKDFLMESLNLRIWIWPMLVLTLLLVAPLLLSPGGL